MASIRAMVCLALLVLLASIAGCGGSGAGSSAPRDAPGGPSPRPTAPRPSPARSVAPTPVPAPDWRISSPEAGRARVVALDAGDPDVVYAGGSRGLFRSLDGGDRWSEANDPLWSVAEDRPHVIGLATDPAASGVLYARLAGRAGEAGSLWRSVDGAESWERLPDAPDAASLLVDPGGSGAVFAGGFPGLFRSDDAGDTWARIASFDATRFGVDPSDARRVLAGSRSTYLTEDGGNTWVELGPPFGGSGGLFIARAGPFRFAPADPKVVYAVSNGRLAVSFDRGRTWELREESIAGDVAIDPRDPAIVHTMAGPTHLRSSDFGATWQPMGGTIGAFGVFHSSMVVDPGDPSRLFLAVSPGGVYRTTSGGRHWARLSTGLGAVPGVRAVAVDPAAPDVLLVGTREDGLFRSEDRGRTWEDVTSVPHRGFAALAFDPFAPGSLYASLYDGNVAASLDGGRTWAQRTFDPSASPDGRVFRADPDGPATVAQLARFPHPPHGIAFDPRGSGALLVARGLPLASPDGESFARVFVPDPPQGLSRDYCRSFLAAAFDAVGTERFYLHTGREVLRTTDGGATWEPHPECRAEGGLPPSAPLDVPYALVAHPTEPGLVYASDRAGVERTLDGGETWELLGVESLGFVYSLLLDPVDPEILYAGTRGNGVFRSRDRGATWEKLGVALDGHPVIGLSVDAVTGRTLAAAVADLGVAVFTLP